MTKSLTNSNSAGQLLLYQTEDGQTKVEVRLENDSLWLTQAQMADLFQMTPQNITLHLKNIYDSEELSEAATCKEYLQVQNEGERQVSRNRKFYNLKAIIAVGYRVASHRGTQFRRWATERLNEYLVKGFTMDDERLKQVSNIGSDYFDEMLERIRDIRSSEKRFYQKIRDIYKLAADYDPKAEETLEFFQIVQNKLHFAASGKTAAEFIAERADAIKSNMGLTSWHGAKVRKTDVTIAKNYLKEDELAGLNRIVTTYLDYAEDQAKLINCQWDFSYDNNRFASREHALNRDGKNGDFTAVLSTEHTFSRSGTYSIAARVQDDLDGQATVAARID